MSPRDEYTTSKGETVILNERSFCHQIKGRRPRYMFLVLTKDNDCKRGEYAEEFDVAANGVAEAKRIAQAIMDRDMIPELRISRVEMR